MSRVYSIALDGDGWMRYVPVPENALACVSEGFCPDCRVALAGSLGNWCPQCKVFWNILHAPVPIT